jgi:hypothetical protein
MLGQQPSFVRFITHSSDSLSTQSGFTANQFRASPAPWDIHCNPKFYQGAFDQIWPTLMAKAIVSV